MGFFDALKSAGSCVARVAVIPVSVVADVATCGGALNDRDEPYTVTTAKQIVEKAGDAVEELHED